MERSPKAEVRAIRGFKWAMVVFSFLSSIFLFSLDNTVLADLVPIIVNQFKRVDQIAWLSVGFTVGAVVLALSFGKLYATFDAKWLYVVSSSLFLVASVLCGAAPNMSVEIVGRVLAGIGGNGMYIGTLTLIVAHTTAVERGVYLGSIGVVWGLGTVLGPVVGGGFSLVGNGGWRWAFYINPLIGCFCVAIAAFMLPATDPIPGTSQSQRFARFDYIGSVLITASMTCLVMAISFGGALFDWQSGSIIALFAVSAVLIICFAVQQVFLIFTRIEDRIFPVHYVSNFNAVLLFISTAAVNTAAFIPIYYTPIYFQFTRGDGALESAVRLLPLIFILAAVIFLNGQIITRCGYYQDWYLFGGVLLLIGGVFMSRINADTSTGYIYGMEVLIAIGAGCSVQAGYTVIYCFIKPEDGSNGISWISLAQLGGIAVGLSVAGSVFVNRAVIRLHHVLPDMDRSDLIAAVSGTSSGVLRTLPEVTRKDALEAIVNGLRQTYILVYVGAAVSLVCAAFLKRINIGKVMSGQA
ncbi:MFS general substrate transporter [Myriangium duriaei CBS 260.36]|uniref:MFS general substrate transporter n=1 Tax=Myriangium duriaei CBS 260.36 TaxID=1168546 RepID=A0A9P4IVF6_9PEZI|nr:MFS general substrate transporter [Myriangium duriaei CBS 260.36]